MPYVSPEARRELEDRYAESVGELTYALTVVVDTYAGSAPDYQRLAECMAALECAKHELYRRVIAPYEDQKRDLNGDAYRLRRPIGHMERAK